MTTTDRRRRGARRKAGDGTTRIAFIGAGSVEFTRNLLGEILYPALDAAIAAYPEGLGRHVRVEIYQRFGYFPTESSEHFAEYVPWVMSDDEQIERLRIPVSEYISRSEENVGFYEEETAASARTHPSPGIHACRRRSARVPRSVWREHLPRTRRRDWLQAIGAW